MTSTEDKITTLQEWVKNSNNIVFFGGAGVSTESGIPDFRSTDGLYNQQYDYPPETIVSRTFFNRYPDEFYRFYKEKILLNAEPNITHKVLARLEEENKLKAVVTQNIDGLHQEAKSKKVLELHGSVHRNYCTKCHTFYSKNFIKESEGLPLCTECGGLIKPDVVLYEEGLDDSIVYESIQAIQLADILIIGGTSLTVYPAAGMIDYYKGKKLVLINKSSTAFDSRADLVINDALGTVFSAL